MQRRGYSLFLILYSPTDKKTNIFKYYVYMNDDMTPDQLIAEELYLDSVSYENDYKPVSFPRLKEMLEKKGVNTSTSALGRWGKKFGWSEKVKQIVTAATVGDGEAADIVAKSSLDKSTKKILKDFEANEELKNDAYMVLSKQMVHYANKAKKNIPLSLDNTKVVIKILEVTSTREDKLLDRQAMLMATKLASSSDVLASLKDEVIEVEIDE